MIAIDITRVSGLIKHFEKRLKKQVLAAKGKLEILKGNTPEADRKAYIQELIDLKDKIVTATSTEIARYKDTFDKRYQLYANGNTDAQNDSDTTFKDEILKALGYSQLRSTFYPDYFRALGIKCCVYCNSQLCVTVEDEKKKRVAKFQVDHFIPKDKYPCFSIALHNLYPVCASCNNKKGIKNVAFSLYDTGASTQESKLKFEIVDCDKTVANFIIDRDSSNIKIKFTEPVAPRGYSTLNDLFSIQGIYNTQIDIVEELILKSIMYDDAYKSFLLKAFKDLFHDKNVLNRLIVGNYTDPADIHNRPLSKFTQDLAKQLKLI